MLKDKITPPKSNGNSRIAIVIPTLNEEQAVGKVLKSIAQVMNEFEHQTVIVDGRSRDNTRDIAKSNGAHVIYQRSKGYGDALKTGFSYAKNQLDAEVIVMLDADCTYDPKDIPQLVIPILKDEVDLVVGNRFQGMKKGSMSLFNRVGNRFLSWFARATLRLGITDTQCGLRAFKSDLLNQMILVDEGMPFATEMLAEARFAGARISETPIAYMPRVGEAKLSPLKDGLRILGTILRLVRDTQPLLFFGGLGILMALGSSVFGLHTLLEWVKTGSVQSLPSLMIFVLLLVGAIQFLSFGLLADMIKRLNRKLAYNRH